MSEALVYRSSDKVRLFASLDSAVEIESDQRFSIGASSRVAFFIDDAPLGLELEGTVIGVRHASPSSPGTVWIEFSENERKRAKERFDLVDGDGQRLQIRNADRTPCDVAMDIDMPVKLQAKVTDISETGCRIDNTLPVPVRQTIRCEVAFEGSRLPIFARVCWRKMNPQDHRAGGTGLVFLFQTEEIRNALATCVSRIRAERQAEQNEASVLMLSSDIGTAEALERILTPKELRFIRCETGLDALIETRKFKPKLVLVDVTTPQGREFLSILRRSPTLSRIPVMSLGPEDIPQHLQGFLHTAPPFKLEQVEMLLSRSAELAPAPPLPSSEGQSTGAGFFAHCHYKSETLDTETAALAAHENMLFVQSPWQEAEGVVASLQVRGPSIGQVEAQVRVVHGAPLDPSANQRSGFWVELPESASARLRTGMNLTAHSEPRLLAVHPSQEILSTLASSAEQAGLRVVGLDRAHRLAEAIQSVGPRALLLHYDPSDKESLSRAEAMKSRSRLPTVLMGELATGDLQSITGPTDLDAVWNTADSADSLFEELKPILGASGA